jgi:hypothetical protein
MHQKNNWIIHNHSFYTKKIYTLSINEKNLLLFLPLATKLITFSFSFHWPPSQASSPYPSIGHQAKHLLLILPLATKLWIYLHLPSPSLEKAGLDDWGALFFFLGETTSN